MVTEQTPMEAEEVESEEIQPEGKEDKIREDIISEYGFDPDDDAERIDKAVKREAKQRELLAKAVGQKQKYRSEYEKLKNTPPKAEPSKPMAQDEDLDKKISVRLEQERLDDMEYPDEIKKLIKRVADVQQISVRNAVKDEYVASHIAKWQKTQNAEEAALSRTNRTGGQAADDDSSVPPKVDFSTEEGIKAYDKWKEKQIKGEMSRYRD